MPSSRAVHLHLCPNTCCLPIIANTVMQPAIIFSSCAEVSSRFFAHLQMFKLRKLHLQRINMQATL